MPPEVKGMTLKESNLTNINFLIKSLDVDKNEISDTYHTFGELYEHRITLFLALCKILYYEVGDTVWKSKLHHDGSSYEGWFIMGIRKKKGRQISYHLPMAKWDETHYCEELERAPEFDGHTSNNVLERLKQL